MRHLAGLDLVLMAARSSGGDPELAKAPGPASDRAAYFEIMASTSA
jgi:hypothetical protein